MSPKPSGAPDDAFRMLRKMTSTKLFGSLPALIPDASWRRPKMRRDSPMFSKEGSGYVEYVSRPKVSQVPCRQAAAYF